MNLQTKKHLLDIDCYSKEEIFQILNDSKIMMEILNRKVKKIPTDYLCNVEAYNFHGDFILDNIIKNGGK